MTNPHENTLRAFSCGQFRRHKTSRNLTNQIFVRTGSSSPFSSWRTMNIFCQNGVVPHRGLLSIDRNHDIAQSNADAQPTNRRINHHKTAEPQVRRVERDAPAGYVRPLIEPYMQFSRIRLTVWNI